ncbi:3-oxoacyl-[acyl-carrier-protein] synthase III C-terminal domain-containing protein [Parageobacillus thermoglucosidasius]|uniref:Beta-ketoacyl-[acyl-carrier-protein] synthase III C-terminal domain-containing protein n=1 Tax=Parageobacillus thermoglucosidasius TaxID=1426 RepID=A0AB38R1L8_PARTM|nr:3-oxoacyl-[acyl-carrier-protein] synthase III C-terminal domain-containing protein [Parageobacillus thermoglucosidasius]UOE77548.1 hypothetical protein IMI45_06935 [Parageobacillus thermoglucosidasius]
MIFIAFIEKFYAHIPKHTVKLDELSGDIGLKKHEIRMFKRYHGIESVLRSEGTTPKDVLKVCIKEIIKDIDEEEMNKIKYILYCHTLQVIQPYHINIINEIKEELGLNHILSFSVTQQNCSSVAAALDIANRMVENSSDKKIIIVSAEKTFTSVAKRINNITIMGEAGFACLVGNEKQENQIVDVYIRNLGEFYKGILADQKEIKRFEQVYIKTLSQTISTVVCRNNLKLEDVKLILPHNINLSSWNQLISFMGLNKDKFFLDNIPYYGHCFCSDGFINLQEALIERDIQSGDYIIMVTVGLGAIFSAVLIKH